MVIYFVSHRSYFGDQYYCSYIHIDLFQDHRFCATSITICFSVRIYLTTLPRNISKKVEYRALVVSDMRGTSIRDFYNDITELRTMDSRLIVLLKEWKISYFHNIFFESKRDKDIIRANHDVFIKQMTFTPQVHKPQQVQSFLSMESRPMARRHMRCGHEPMIRCHINSSYPLSMSC